MSSFDLRRDSDGQDLLSDYQFESMATASQGQAHEYTGSASFITPLATSSFSPSNSLVGGHVQGVRNTHCQYHTSTPEAALDGQRRYHPRQYQNTSPFLPIAGSLHQFDGTASMRSPAHDPDPFHGAQHGSFDIPTRRDRAFGSSPLRVNQASALHGLSSFPVDPTTSRASNMHTMHGNTERDRRDEEAFLHYPNSNVGLGAAHTQSRTHRYRHEQDRWHSATMALDGDYPAHISDTAPPAAFGSSNTGNPIEQWRGNPQATTRFDGSDPMLSDERSLLPSSEHHPRVAPRRPQFRPRPSMPTPALHEHHGRRSPSTSAHDFLRGQTDRTRNDMTYAIRETRDYAGQDNHRAYQQTARQSPLLTSPVFTDLTLNLHGGNRGQYDAYGLTAGGTNHPQWVVPEITVSQAPASTSTLFQEDAAGNSDLHSGNTHQRRSATTSQSSKKESQRKGRTLRPLSNYDKEERAYKRRSGTVCGSCRLKKIKCKHGDLEEFRSQYGSDDGVDTSTLAASDGYEDANILMPPSLHPITGETQSQETGIMQLGMHFPTYEGSTQQLQELEHISELDEVGHLLSNASVPTVNTRPFPFPDFDPTSIPTTSSLDYHS